MAATTLLLLALGARVWNLADVPPGLTHDEASNGHDSAAILRGVHRIYFPVGYGHEPLYNYSVALTTALLGQGIITLRLTTVVWGVAQIVLTAAIARRWWGRSAALATLGVYAASFWALMLARVGLRAPTLPVLLAASVLAYDYAQSRSTHGASPRARLWYGLAGLLLGLSFYTYMASRGMPLLFLGYAAILAVVDRRRFRRVWRGTLLLLAVAALVGAPLFLHLRANPGLEQRVSQLGQAVVAMKTGDLRPLWANIADSLPMLLWQGDPYWLYNIAGRPGLEPLLAVGFAVGLSASLLHLRDPRNILLLLWLGGGTAPALLTPVAYNLLHAVGAMPAVLLLAARGLCVISRLGRGTAVCPRAWSWLRTATILALALAFVATSVESLHAYFVMWTRHRNVRVAYHHHVVALGRHLDRVEATGPVVITTLYPGEFHDPYTMEVTLRRDDLALRWVDGREAIVFPNTPARLFVETQTQLAATLWAEVSRDSQVLTVLTYGQDAIPTETRGYLWNAPATWRRIVSAAETKVLVGTGDPPQLADHRVTSAPIDFGTSVRLLGYRATERVDPGADLELVTLWEVLAPSVAAASDLAIFAHLLDAEGTLLDQDDRLGAPSWQWQSGDHFAQVHRLDRASAPAPGCCIALGIYDRATLVRLPVVASEMMPTGTATRILLPIEVQIP
ncbi:MAG: glycosyltransferase family 39 protein [Anaerolineae bacterium]|nr:glycosyltransferase family 39 protein [Anaerolineae bacterium]